jgi:hypothetical protein
MRGVLEILLAVGGVGETMTAMATTIATSDRSDIASNRREDACWCGEKVVYECTERGRRASPKPVRVCGGKCLERLTSVGRWCLRAVGRDYERAQDA